MGAQVALQRCPILHTSQPIVSRPATKSNVKEFRKEFSTYPLVTFLSKNLDHLTILGVRASIVSHIGVLENIKPVVNTFFLYYYLQTYDMSRLAKKTTGVDSISFSDVKQIPVPVPPLADQERIVRLLDEAHALRRLRRQANQRMNAFIPALFHEMFGDPAVNNKGWSVVPVGSLMILCEYGTSQKANEDGQGIPVLRMNNVEYSGDLNLSNLKHVVLNEREYKKQLLQEGDVLFNRTNSRELVGKTGMWDGRFKAVAASYFIRVQFDHNIEHPQHFVSFMNLPHSKQRLAEMARGAVGQANINAQELQSIMMPLPPIALQNEFAVRVKEARSLQSAQQRSTERIEATFQSMLVRAFSGEL